MKNKKLILFTVSAILSAAVIISLNFYNIEQARRVKGAASPIQINTKELENQIQQLKLLINGLVRMNVSTKNNLEKEIIQARGLRRMFEETSLRNETLSEKLEKDASRLELTQGVRQKLLEVEKTLSRSNLGPSQEKELKNILWESHRKLDHINYLIPDFIKDNKSYKNEAQRLERIIEKKDADIRKWKEKSKEAKYKNSGLSKSLNLLSFEIKMLKKARGAGETKGLALEKAVRDLEDANSSLNSEALRLKEELKSALSKSARELKEKNQADKDRQAAIDRQKSLEEELSKLNQSYGLSAKELDSLNSKALRLKEELKSALSKSARELKEKTQADKDRQAAIDRQKSLEEELSKLNQSYGLSIKELDSLRQNIQQLSKENQGLKVAAEKTQKLQDELTLLQEKSRQLQSDYESLKNDALIKEDQLKQNSLELGRRADRILTLSEKLLESEDKVSQTQSKSQSLQKDTAILREENVSLRIEKTSLSGRLEKTMRELEALEKQAAQISSILQGAKLQADSALEDSVKNIDRKRVEVEIYPSEGASLENEKDENTP